MPTRKENNIKRMIYYALLGNFPITKERERCYFDGTLIGSHISHTTKEKLDELFALLPSQHRQRITYRVIDEIGKNVKKQILDEFGLSSFVFEKDGKEMNIIVGTTEKSLLDAERKVMNLKQKLVDAQVFEVSAQVKCIRETCGGQLIERLTKITVRLHPKPRLA